MNPVTSEIIDGFFLIPKHANIEYFDVLFTDNTIYNGTNPVEGFELSLVAGSTIYDLAGVGNSNTFYLKDTYNSPVQC